MHRPSSEVAGASSGSGLWALAYVLYALSITDPTQPNQRVQRVQRVQRSRRQDSRQQAAGSAPELEHSGRIRTEPKIQIQTQSPITSHQSRPRCGPIPPVTSPAQARAAVLSTQYPYSPNPNSGATCRSTNPAHARWPARTRTVNENEIGHRHRRPDLPGQPRRILANPSQDPVPAPGTPALLAVAHTPCAAQSRGTSYDRPAVLPRRVRVRVRPRRTRARVRVRAQRGGRARTRTRSGSRASSRFEYPPTSEAEADGERVQIHTTHTIHTICDLRKSGKSQVPSHKPQLTPLRGT